MMTWRFALLPLTFVAALAAAGDKEPPPIKITAAQALAAYDRFSRAPEQNLNEAPTFLNFMQGGSVHTVLNSNVVFWMYRDLARDAQAVLYAAYMGGNLDSQLRGPKHGDDPEAGMRATLIAYRGLQKTHPKLVIPEFESLAQAETQGKLRAAVDALSQPVH